MFFAVLLYCVLKPMSSFHCICSIVFLSLCVPSYHIAAVHWPCAPDVDAWYRVPALGPCCCTALAVCLRSGSVTAPRLLRACARASLLRRTAACARAVLLLRSGPTPVWHESAERTPSRAGLYVKLPLRSDVNAADAAGVSEVAVDC